MYEEVIRHIDVDLTADELELLHEVLDIRRDQCVSLGETITLDMLTMKLLGE